VNSIFRLLGGVVDKRGTRAERFATFSWGVLDRRPASARPRNLEGPREKGVDVGHGRLRGKGIRKGATTSMSIIHREECKTEAR